MPTSSANRRATRNGAHEPRPTFPPVITDFAGRYADQNDRDYQAFADAIRSGRLEAREGI